MLNQGSSFFRNIPPVTKNLIIINFIVWLAMLILPHRLGIDFVRYGGLHYVTAPDFNPAQIVTYMFMHSTDSIAHLFFNMFTLFMFGMTLERVLGGKRYLFYYLSTGIGAALVQELVWGLTLDSMATEAFARLNGLAVSQAREILAMPEFAQQSADFISMVSNSLVTIGASGAVFGILLAFGMIFPNRPLYLMFIPIPIKAKWMVIGYGVLELFFGVSGTMSSVAHFAHLGGMIFGLIMILYWKRNGTIHGTYY
ncbi:MAG: rhomboid family intramembrane serine protease [Pseudoflavonifractor sp.]|nr:rhomboid family intramembrane serine protease [Pseudoflavonifractor sp.]